MYATSFNASVKTLVFVLLLLLLATLCLWQRQTHTTLAESTPSASWSGFCAAVAQSSVFVFGSFASIFFFVLFCSFCKFFVFTFMSAQAAVKGCVGVAKVLPYILNMLVACSVRRWPVGYGHLAGQMASWPAVAGAESLGWWAAQSTWKWPKRQLNAKAAKAGSKNHLATKRVIYAATMIRAGRVQAGLKGATNGENGRCTKKLQKKFILHKLANFKVCSHKPVKFLTYWRKP